MSIILPESHVIFTSLIFPDLKVLLDRAEEKYQNASKISKDKLVSKLKTSLSKASSDLNSVRQELDHLQTKISQNSEFLSKTIEDKNMQIDEFDVKNFLLRSKISSYETNFKEMNQVLENERMKTNCLTQQNSNLLGFVEREKNLNSQSVMTLQNERDSQTQVMASMKSTIEILKQRIEKKDSKIDQIENQKEKMEENIINLKNSLKNYENDLKALSDAQENVKTSYLAEKEVKKNLLL